MVSKGLLTFLGSLYKEVSKTTTGTLVYRFERQTRKKKKIVLPLKNTVSSTKAAGFLPQGPSDSSSLFLNVIFQGK